MITLHYLENSRSTRIVWLLEELQLPYELKVYYRNPQTMLAPPELAKIYPTGTAPIITDGDMTLAESGLIVEYLLEKYGQNSELIPKTEGESWHVRYGIMQCESNLMISTMQLYVNFLARGKIPFPLRFISNKILDAINQAYAKPELLKLLKILDTTFETNGGFYSKGHLTGADIMYDRSITLIRKNELVPGFDDKFPHIVQWQKRNSERPAYKKMQEVEADVQKKKASV